MVERIKSIEAEGATVREAIKKALATLKVSKDDVTIRIVCEEQKGLFGMDGAKKAKIIATLKENN